MKTLRYRCPWTPNSRKVGVRFADDNPPGLNLLPHTCAVTSSSAASLWSTMVLHPERPGDPAALTPLQREIVALVMNGLTNREIAVRLRTTPGAVAVQIGRALHKLGLA